MMLVEHLCEAIWKQMKVKPHIRDWHPVRLVLDNQRVNRSQDSNCLVEVLDKVVGCNDTTNLGALSLMSCLDSFPPG